MEVTTDIEIAAPIEKVAARLLDFEGLHRWYPGLEEFRVEGSGIGAVRSYRISDQWFHERLDELDDDRCGLGYTVVEGPLPVSDFHARYMLREKKGGTQVVWLAEFTVATKEAESGIAFGAVAMQEALLTILQLILEEDIELVS